MWILPKNQELSCRYVAAMVELKEDLTLLESNIESSLMWRSKPTQLRTWFQRWNRVSWMPHLCGRILKPCQWSRFEDELTLSLAATHANLSVSLEKEEQKKTKDISGLTSEKSSEQFDLFDVSLKTSKDTSTLDSEKSLATWKALITKRRGEYSARLKSAHPIREKGSSLWPTPNTLDYLPPRSAEATKKMQQGHRKGRKLPSNLRERVDENTMKLYQKWPTVRVSSANGATQKELSEGNPKRRLETEVLLWPTPTVQDSDKATKKMRDNHQNNLTAVVFDQEILPTPTARDWKGGYKQDALIRKDGKSRKFDALPNAAIGGVGTDIVPGHLNPEFCEWLMGVPIGWTELDWPGMG